MYITTDMKFCEECGNVLSRNTNSGEVMFNCTCGEVYKGNPSDTLISEVYLETENSTLKYNTMLDLAAGDMTNKIVRRKCPGCNLDFMKIVRIGNRETVIYICDCGKRILNDGTDVSLETKEITVEGGLERVTPKQFNDNRFDYTDDNLFGTKEDVETTKSVTGSFKPKGKPHRVFNLDTSLRSIVHIRAGRKTTMVMSALPITSGWKENDVLIIKSNDTHTMFSKDISGNMEVKPEVVKAVIVETRQYDTLEELLEVETLERIDPEGKFNEKTAASRLSGLDNKHGYRIVEFFVPRLRLYLSDEFMEKVVSNDKTAGVRMATPKYAHWHTGDVVTLFNKNYHVCREIMQIKKVKSLVEALEFAPASEILGKETTDENAIKEITESMRGYDESLGFIVFRLQDCGLSTVEQVIKRTDFVIKQYSKIYSKLVVDAKVHMSKSKTKKEKSKIFSYKDYGEAKEPTNNLIKSIKSI